MDVIVHYPKNQKDIEILKKRVATVHADAVIKYLDKLSCTKEQKFELVNSLINKG